MKIFTCWNCGKYVTEDLDYHQRVYCQSCLDKKEKEHEAFMNEYLTMKTQIAWERALRHMEFQEKVNINDYYSEAQYVKELALNDFNKFQSSYEMMAAMELLKSRIKCKVQHKILKYKVDFYLPTMKAVLEIDGRLHDFKVKKDSDRDVAILTELNAKEKGWEVVRIPTEYLDKDITKLVPAIAAVRKEKQRLRRLNGGFIPASFSRNATYQTRKIAKITEDSSLKELDNLLEDTIPDEL